MVEQVVVNDRVVEDIRWTRRPKSGTPKRA
jgi:hypothetical protein